MIMTDKEREEFLAFMEEFKKQVVGNKKLAREFLIKAGIYTKEGKLTEPYQHLYIPPLVEASCIRLDRD
jgi:hypothetical protein